MNRSRRNPDAIDRIREDALTEQKPNLHNKMMNYQNKIEDALARPNKGEAYLTAVQFAAEIDARIAELEAQLAAATERERGYVALLGDIEWVLDKEYLFRYCPECDKAQDEGHAAGCRIAAALAAAQQEAR